MAMHYPIVAKPYRFVPPHAGRLWPALLRPAVPLLAWLYVGVRRVEIRGLEHLSESLAAGHGLMLCPNHPRRGDPLLVSRLSAAAGRPFHYMAAWYLFERLGTVSRWALRRCGAFSVHREALDREALKTATRILAAGGRPLVVFPEGVVTRLNDRVCTLLDGPAFIARAAARQRAQTTPAGRVVVHPVALKYYFRGDPHAAAERILEDLERRLTWRSQRHRPLVERVYLVSRAVMALKEIELFGSTQEGTLPRRIAHYIDALLRPLEVEWLGGAIGGSVAERVKRLRGAITPDLIAGELGDAERARRWGHLSDIHTAQAASFYPGDYVASRPTADRILETLERFEEDTAGRCRVLRPFDAVLEVGAPLTVAPERAGRPGGEDPLTAQLQGRIQAMLDRLLGPPIAPPVGAPTGNTAAGEMAEPNPVVQPSAAPSVVPGRGS
jgi:1-acyl-sn-glycerol-3-phosphate acyltransferase